MSFSSLCRLAQSTLHATLEKAGPAGVGVVELVHSLYPYITQDNVMSYLFEIDVIEEVVRRIESKGRAHHVVSEDGQSIRFYAV